MYGRSNGVREVILHNIVPKHVEALTVKLQELGVDIEIEDEK